MDNEAELPEDDSQNSDEEVQKTKDELLDAGKVLQRTEESPSGRRETSQLPDLTKKRVRSIDALRGFDMIWIIGFGGVVQKVASMSSHPTMAAIGRQMRHVKWEGFHFEDLIFPLFLFIMGLVLPYSLLRRMERGATRRQMYLHIISRTAILFLMGLIKNGLLELNFEDFRYTGVLQRIAICYFFAALLVIHFRVRGLLIFTASVLLLYWAALMLIPVPGHGAGQLTMEGSLSSYIDQLLLPGYLYYEFGDNEGILSTFPATCTVIIGVLTGFWLRTKRNAHLKALFIALAGGVLLGTGYYWGEIFPIIKKIWTSSFVLYAAGWSMLLLAVFYWIIDACGFWRWSIFFIVVGMNAITIYFLQGIINFVSITDFFVGGVSKLLGEYQLLFITSCIFALKWLFLYFLYRHKIFLKV